MSDSPKNLPRFLPTLTEVVSPSVVMASGVVAAPAASAPEADATVLIERVMQRLDLSLAARMREVIGAFVDEQMRALAPGLMQEVEQAVRESVAQAVALELESQQRT